MTWVNDRWSDDHVGTGLIKRRVHEGIKINLTANHQPRSGVSPSHDLQRINAVPTWSLTNVIGSVSLKKWKLASSTYKTTKVIVLLNMLTIAESGNNLHAVTCNMFYDTGVSLNFVLKLSLNTESEDQVTMMQCTLSHHFKQCYAVKRICSLIFFLPSSGVATMGIDGSLPSSSVIRHLSFFSRHLG